MTVLVHMTDGQKIPADHTEREYEHILVAALDAEERTIELRSKQTFTRKITLNIDNIEYAIEATGEG